MANAKLTPSRGRQYVLAAEVAFDYTQVADTGVAVPAIKLPYGATVISGEVIVDTAFNSSGTGHTYTLDVGDAANGARYANDVNLLAAGRTAVTLTGFKSDGAEINIIPAIAAMAVAPTAGSARVLVRYVIEGRAHENQPN